MFSLFNQQSRARTCMQAVDLFVMVYIIWSFLNDPEATVAEYGLPLITSAFDFIAQNNPNHKILWYASSLTSAANWGADYTGLTSGAGSLSNVFKWIDVTALEPTRISSYLLG